MKKINLLKYLLPFFSAMILIMAFPRFNQSYMAWMALIPLILFILKTRPREAFAGGIIFGSFFHLYINYYLTEALSQFLGPLFTATVFILIIIYLSLFYGFLFYLAALLRIKFPPSVFVFIFSFLWMLMEYSRSLGFLGYTAGYIGYSQWSYPFILNITSFYGYWGLPFLMVSFQTVIAMRFVNNIKGKIFIKLAVLWILLTTAALIIPAFSPVISNNETKKIVLIQANIPGEDLLTSNPDNLNAYERLTRKALQDVPETDLVVWAETVISARLGGGDPAPAAVRNLSEELKTPLLYGAITIEDDRRFNSIVLLYPDEREPQIYNKNILVPVVEFFPLEDTLNQWLSLRILLGSLHKGKDFTVFNFDGEPVAGVICFESFFGNYTRNFAAKGAQHLFILTNDGWLGKSIGLDQHAAMVTIRAAETGIGVTQVANTGITVSADYKGRELFRSGINSEEIHLLKTDFSYRNTFYKTAGDYLIYFGLFFLILSFSAFRIKNSE